MTEEATHNVWQWLGNDEKLYTVVNRLQRTWYNGAHEDESVRGDCLRAFANAIRNYCVQVWPSLKTPDGFCLADVDWLEIANDWVEG